MDRLRCWLLFQSLLQRSSCFKENVFSSSKLLPFCSWNTDLQMYSGKLLVTVVLENTFTNCALIDNLRSRLYFSISSKQDTQWIFTQRNQRWIYFHFIDFNIWLLHKNADTVLSVQNILDLIQIRKNVYIISYICWKIIRLICFIQKCIGPRNIRLFTLTANELMSKTVMKYVTLWLLSLPDIPMIMLCNCTAHSHTKRQFDANS